MKWDRSLLLFMVACLLLIIGVGLVEPWILAESVAEQLAPRLGADKDTVRIHLQEIFSGYSLRRMAVHSLPFGIVILALLARIVTKKPKQSTTG